MSTAPNARARLYAVDPAEVTFHDVVAFCQEGSPEDVDLDYKSALPSDLERVVCAFANTQGGLVLIGVQEQGKTAIPVCPPTGVDGDKDALRNRVLSICFDAIYPPIEPQVFVCTDPATGLHVVGVRIAPSPLLHAVDRRSRIYIRSLDNNRGYALASLADLKWLWDRRATSQAFRASLADAARQRASSPAIVFGSPDLRARWSQMPHLLVSVMPAYPSIPAVASVRTLLGIADSLQEVRSPWRGVDRRIPWQAHGWRTFSGGVCIGDRGDDYVAQYMELGCHCHAYFDFMLSRRAVNTLPRPRSSGEECVFAYVILSSLDVSLRFAGAFFHAASFHMPVILESRVTGVANTLLQYQPPAFTNPLALEYLSLPSIDDDIVLCEEELLAAEVSPRAEDILFASARSLLWGFGVGWDDSSIQEWLRGH